MIFGKFKANSLTEIMGAFKIIASYLATPSKPHPQPLSKGLMYAEVGKK
jgi:hypothetical protein